MQRSGHYLQRLRRSRVFKYYPFLFIGCSNHGFLVDSACLASTCFLRSLILKKPSTFHSAVIGITTRTGIGFCRVAWLQNFNKTLLYKIQPTQALLSVSDSCTSLAPTAKRRLSTRMKGYFHQSNRRLDDPGRVLGAGSLTNRF